MTHDYYQKKKERRVWIPKKQREPTHTYSNGTRVWCKRNYLHRDDGAPAYIDADGTQKWYHQGLLHRENNQPAVVRRNGTREWWVHGVRRYPCVETVVDFIYSIFKPAFDYICQWKIF